VPKPVTTSTLEALRALQTAEPAVEPHASVRAVFGALAVVGLFAAVAITFVFVRENTLSTLELTAAAEVDALVNGSARLGATLRTFAVMHEPESQWFSDTSELLDELHTRAKSADATLVGIAMKPRARVAESLQTAAEAVELARTNAETKKNPTAREVIESNGYPAADALEGALVAVRAAAADEIGSMRTRWRLSAGLVLAAWALVWGFGLAWFAYLRVEAPTMPADRDARPHPDASESVEADATLPLMLTAIPEPVLPPSLPPPPAMRDSATVADACEAVAGLSDAAQIGPALEGIAHALGASGLVLWMRDGDTLAAAASHGYPPDLPRRLGRVTANDQNLIARAWQERASQTAPEAPGQRAAVAAPIGATGVVTGVLSAEFPLGREADADVVATSRILAAQLSVVLGESTTNGAGPHLEALGS